MAVKNFGKESKVESAGQLFHAKALPKASRPLYRAGLEYRLSGPFIYLLEFAQITGTIKFIYAVFKASSL